jgi:hypothetical protein
MCWTLHYTWRGRFSVLTHTIFTHTALPVLLNLRRQVHCCHYLAAVAEYIRLLDHNYERFIIICGSRLHHVSAERGHRQVKHVACIWQKCLHTSRKSTAIYEVHWTTFPKREHCWFSIWLFIRAIGHFCGFSATSKHPGLPQARMSCCAGRHIWTHAWSTC